MTVANILDLIHAELDPLVWDDPMADHPVLKPVHAHWIKSRVYKTLEDGGYTDVEKWLTLVLTGSLTTYQYSTDSDVDISLFVDTKIFPEWSRAEMIALMVDKLDGTTLPGTPFPLQDFVVGEGIKPSDLYKPGLRSGYNIDNGKWIVPPERNRVHDVKAEQGGFYAWALQMADKMERLLKYEPEQAIAFWHSIHKKRQRDMMKGKGDFSESNIIYKMLAQRGLFPSISQASGEYIAHRQAPHDSSDIGGRTSLPLFVGEEGPERTSRSQTSLSPDHDDGRRDTSRSESSGTVGTDPNIMYHVAPVEHREAIEQNGLQPNAPEGGYPHGIYVFHDPENAQFFKEHMEDRDRDEYGDEPLNERDIWQVDTTGHTLRHDPAVGGDDDFQREYPQQPLRSQYTYQPIGPERLRLFPEISQASGEHIAKTAASDWFAPSYMLPEDAKQQIHEWAQTLPWPEGSKFAPPERYHVTGIYSPSGYSDPSHQEWAASHSGLTYPVQTSGVDNFTPSKVGEGAPVVLRVHHPQLEEDTERLIDEAQARGLPVSRFPGGYKPHITVGHSPTPMQADHPGLSFPVGPLRDLHGYYDELKRTAKSAPKPPNYRDAHVHCPACQVEYDHGVV